MKRFLLRVMPVSVTLLLLLMVLLAVAPFTESGSRLLLRSAANFLPLQIDYAGGSLFGNLQLSKVHLENETLQLEIRGLDAELDISCLWNSQFCFRRLAAASVDVAWDGGSWHSETTLAQVTIVDSKVVVESLHTSDALLTLSERGRTATGKSDTSVKLPVELLLRNARLERAAWNIYGKQYQHEFITLKGQWLGHKLTLEQIEIGDNTLGLLQLAGRITFTGDWPFELEANANWRGTPGLAKVMEAFSPETQLTSESLLGVSLLSPWKLSATGTRSEQSFSVESAISGLGYDYLNLSFSASHLATADDSQEPTRLVFDHIELRDGGSASELSGSGELLMGESLQWQLSAGSSGFDLPFLNDALSGRLGGSFVLEGTFLGDTWNVALSEIDLRGTVNDLPAMIEGQVNFDEKLSLYGSDLQAHLNGAKLHVLTQSDETPGLDLRLSVAEMGQWQPDSSGELVLSAVLSEDFNSATVQGSVHNFKWQDVTVQRGNFSAEVDLTEDYNFSLEAIFTKLVASSAQLEKLSFSASGNQHKQSLRIATRGDIELNLAGQGEFAAQDGGGRGSVALRGELKSLAGMLAEGHDLKGNLKLELATDWTADASPGVRGEILLLQPELSKDLGEGRYATVNWTRASIRFDKGIQGIQLDASAIKNGEKILSMNFTLPAQDGKPLSGDIFLEQLDLQDFQAFVPTLSNIRGSASGRLRLSGTGREVLSHGEIELVDGSFSILDNPTVFEALQLQVKVQGDQAVMDGTLLLGGGHVDITGNIGYKPEPFIELQLIGQRETLLFPPSTQLQVSHDITLLATAEYLDVSGKLLVHEGVLEQEELPKGGIALSDDVVVLGDARPQRRPFDLRMDVQVTIEDHFQVRGSIVDATVGGDLHLFQQRNRPLQLFGNLNVVGGELRAYGQHLKVRQGTVAFSGPPENPSLDMRAERVIASENITVGLALQGTLEDPILDVYSDPVKPRTETLSYLVRGRGLDAGAAADGTALALSMGASVVNQTGVLRELDKLPGINSVEFGADGSEDDTTATVSGYIGSRIYLSYGVGLYEPINVLTARLYLQTRLWLEVVSSLENSLDLYYSFDIE